MAQISLTGQIENADISSGSGKQIDRTKTWHVFNDLTGFNGDETTAVATKVVKLFVARNAGTLLNVGALCKETGSAGSTVFDIKKGSTSMLSSTISIAYTDTDNVEVGGTLSSTEKSYVSGDIITAHITGAATGALGAVLSARREEMGNT